MKRINLIKYGFIKSPADDFSDDGNRFTGYRVGKRLRVSKLVSDGTAYLSGQISDASLPYEIYSKLPNYNKAVWEYNGVDVDGLTDDDLREFYKACVDYDKEYDSALASLVYPTFEEVTEQCKRVHLKLGNELNEIQELLGTRGVEFFLNCGSFNITSHIRQLANEFAFYNPATYPQKVFGTTASIHFVKPDFSILHRESYCLRQIKEVLQKTK